MIFSLSVPRSRLRIWSHEAGFRRPVRASPLILYSQAFHLGLFIWGFSSGAFNVVICLLTGLSLSFLPLSFPRRRPSMPSFIGTAYSTQHRVGRQRTCNRRRARCADSLRDDHSPGSLLVIKCYVLRRCKYCRTWTCAPIYALMHLLDRQCKTLLNTCKI